MAFVGLFMGGSPHAMIPAGQAVINLQWQAENRQDTPGASFKVTGPGVNKTIPAGTDGRATLTVSIGTYTVSVTHAGAYLGDDPTRVNTESQKSYLVFFDGKVDRNAEIDGRLNAMDSRISSLDRELDTKLDKSYYEAHAEVIKNVASKPVEIKRSGQSIADLGIDVTWSVLDTENLAGHTATLEVGGSVLWKSYTGYDQVRTEFIKIDKSVSLDNAMLLSGLKSLRGLYYLGDRTFELSDHLTVRIILDDGRIFSKA